MMFLLLFLMNSAQAKGKVEIPSYPEFDHAVLIKSVLDNGNLGFCSGVIVNSQTVLTAAHCIDHNSHHRIQIQGKLFNKWVFSKKAQRSSQYHPDLSKSDGDIGILTFDEKLPFSDLTVCEKDHAQDTLYRVGFGGRNGQNSKMVFTLHGKGITGKGAQLALDTVSVSGDSGGPIYAIESNKACLYAIHSSIGLEKTPEESFNPVIKRTSLPLLLGK